MTTTYDVKVGYDGNVENYEYTLNFSKSTIDMIKAMSAIGNESCEFNLENLSNEMYINLSQKYPNAKIKVNSYYDNGGNAIIYIKSNEAVVLGNETVKITKSNNEMIYNHTFKENYSDNEFNSGIKINYRLEMPGEIIDSNADKVDGRVAEWHTNAYELSKHGGCIYAVSKIERPNYMIYITSVGILLVVIISIIFIKRLKNSKTKNNEKDENNDSN